MTDKLILQPELDHPITITVGHCRLVVTVAGKVIADTGNALTLGEASYPPALDAPLDDVDVDADAELN